MPDIVPTYKRGDTWPPLYRQLNESVNGGALQPINLTTALSISYLMQSGATVVSQVVTNPTNLDVDANGLARNYSTGWVEVAWDANDLDIPGTYKFEFQITWAAGKIQTVPNVKIKLS